MIKQSIALIVFSCAMSNAAFAFLNEKALLKTHHFKKSHAAIKSQNDDKPNFTGKWAGACSFSDGDTQDVKFNISHRNGTVKIEDVDSDDDVVNEPTIGAINVLQTRVFSDSAEHRQDSDRFRWGPNNTLILDMISLQTPHVSMQSQSEPLSSVIATATLSLNNNQLMMNATVKHFYGVENDVNFSWKCALNKASQNQAK